MVGYSYLINKLSDWEIELYEHFSPQGRKEIWSNIPKAKSTAVALLTGLLIKIWYGHGSNKIIKHTKTILCECKRCNVSINTYHRRLKSVR